MNKKILGMAIAAAFSVAAGAAQAIVIDDFDGAEQSVSAPGSDTAAYTGAIGGFRTVDITSVGPLTATAAVIAPPGIYSHSADALTSATSTITWDADGAGLGGVDLLEGLINNVFSFVILGIDQGNVDLVFSVGDTSSGSDSFTFTGAGTGTQTVAFSNFTGVDFTTIDSLSLQVVGAVASDLTLDLLSTTGDQPPPGIPEPGSLALLGLGLTAFGFARRKAKL